MGLRRRLMSFVGMGGCIFGLVACGELLNAQTHAADGSPSSDANATGNNASSGNQPTGNANTGAGNTNGTASTGAGNTNAMAGNANAGNANANNPNAGTTPSNSLALAQGCTQATVTYGTGASAVISANCTSCHAGQSVKLGTYAQSVTAMRDKGGTDQVVDGFMPMGSTLAPADKCTLYNWADNAYAQ